MTDIDRSFGLGTLRKDRTRLADMWRLVVSFLNRYRTSRHMIGLEGFSDNQLADIGLTRGDLIQARHGTTIAGQANSHSRAAQIRLTQLYLL